MIRIAICDDEPIALQMLSEHIARALAGQELSVSCFSSGSALRESLLSNHSFDVLFLDINMPDVNGIYLARHIRPLMGDALLIFVSSQDDAVFDSFAAEPFRFLRKSRLDAELPQLSRDLLVKLQERGGAAPVAAVSQVLCSRGSPAHPVSRIQGKGTGDPSLRAAHRGQLPHEGAGSASGALRIFEAAQQFSRELSLHLLHPADRACSGRRYPSPGQQAPAERDQRAVS